LAIVARSASAAQKPRPVELHELAHHLALPEELGDVSTSRCVAPSGSRPSSLTPPPAHQHGDRLPEHGRLGLDAADPQPRTPSPLTMVCGNRSHQRVGYAGLPSASPPGQLLEFTWWTIPCRAGPPEVPERPLPIAGRHSAPVPENSISAFSAKHRGPIPVHLDRCRSPAPPAEGVDPRRSPEATTHRAWRRGPHARDAGEVLEQDPRRHERHLRWSRAGSQRDRAAISSFLTVFPSSRRSRFSRDLEAVREPGGSPPPASGSRSRRKISNLSPPTCSRPRLEAVQSRHVANLFRY